QPATISTSAFGSRDRHVYLSADGHYLSFGAYLAAPSGVDPAASSSAAVPRVAGLITADGSLDISTQLTDAYDSTTIRGAYTTDGTSIWTSGDNASGFTATGGLRYTTRGSSTTVNLSQVQTFGGPRLPDNVRGARVFNGQLYDSSGSDSSIGKGFFQVGTGLP